MMGGAWGKALYDELLSQKDRLFLWVPVAFAMGIALYFALPFEPSAAAAACLLAAVLAAWLYRRGAGGGPASLILGGAVWAQAGLVAAVCASLWYGTPILPKDIRFTQAAGTIETIEHLGPGQGSRIVLRDVVLEKRPPSQSPRRIRLRVRKDEDLEAGQSVSALVNLSPPSPPVAPGAYDFQRHLFFEGIGGVGFAYKQPRILSEAPKNSVTRFFNGLRTAIQKRIEARPETAGGSAGIMSALITGQRGAIDPADDEAMRQSGLYHLLSISGTHVSMVAAILFFCSRFGMALIPSLALRYPIKKFAALIAMSGAVFYMMLAGADVPAQRAVLMTGLVLLAIVLDRSPFSLRLLALSALVVLSIAPQALIGVSFQMSFAAVGALICFFEYIEPVWKRLRSRAGFFRRGVLYMSALFLTSLIAGSVTGLFSLYHFQQFSLYGVLSNMMAVPLTGFVIMPAAIVSVLAMPFGAEHYGLAVMAWGTQWLMAVAHWTAALDGAAIHVRQWPPVTLGLLGGGFGLFLIWRGWRGKGAALLLIAAGLAVGVTARQPDILVSDGGDVIAVREGSELYFSSLRKHKFTIENWQRLAGREGEKPASFSRAPFAGQCDGHGCRIERDGQKIALSFDQKAWREDCGWAGLVIAQVPVRKAACAAPRQYDLFDFKNGGAHGFYIEKDGVDVRGVARERGRRPWVIEHGAAQKRRQTGLP